MILTSQSHSLNKIELGFKSGITHSKGLKRKKVSQHVCKCYHSNILDHLESFCFDKSRRYKGRNHIHFRTTNTLKPKKIGVPKVKA